MKQGLTSTNSQLPKGLEQAFKTFSKKAQTIYKQHAESQQNLELLQDAAQHFYHQHIESKKLQHNLQPLIERVKNKGCRYVFRIIQSEQFKVTLHLVPSGTSFPPHSHPNTLNMIIVDTGELQLQQFSTANYNSARSFNVLSAKQCCVGLKYYKNCHQFYSSEPVTLFFSICLQVENPPFALPKQWLKKVLGLQPLPAICT